MSNYDSSPSDDPPPSRADMLVINRLCDQFEEACRNWSREQTDDIAFPTAESLLDQVGDSLRVSAIRELIPIEMEYRSSAGQTLLLSEYKKRFPEVGSGWFINLLQESVSDADLDLTSTGVFEEIDSSSASFETDDDLSGDTLRRIGQYEIIGVLGSGGMGTVYQAVHREMQRDVALKMMRSDVSQHESSRKRFRREVLAAAKLVHPNIVTAYDAGEFKGQPFLVSELIDGVDLRKKIRDDGALSVAKAIKYTIDAAKGLSYAHQNEITHRDIKPANLLLAKDDTVKILDLGLARLSAEIETPQQSSELTHSGTVMGTAGYMAPEQARSSRTADARSDIYSLGCVLYFLLEARPPFHGESMVDTLIAHATEPIPELESTIQREAPPQELLDLIRRMMAKSPDDRPQSMNEVIDGLNAICDPSSSTTNTQTIQVTQLSDLPVARPAEVQAKVPAAAPSYKKPESAKLQTPVTPANTKTGSTTSANPLPKHVWLIGAAALAILGVVGWAIYGDGGTRYEPGSNGSAQALDGLNNRALLFDGQSSFLSVPSIENGPGEQVTMEIIARLDEHHVANPISWTGGNWMALFHSTTWGIARLQGSRSLFFREDGDQRIDIGQWRHIAGTWDGRELNLFIDGEPAVRGNLDFDLGRTDPGLFIGGAERDRLPRGQSDRFFSGAIDAVRIVERVVYPPGESFTPPPRLERVPNTLVLLQFDESPGAETFRDESGNRNHATATNVQSILRE